ncbi:MAG: DUF488 family protein [Spirochaetes bacterium]|nr:DUF488 family protein [Spirochaetota bacterium]
MAIRIVQLGSPRIESEGLRIGTVRRLPRGVPKSQLASSNYFDVWLPQLAPTDDLLKIGQNVKDLKDWNLFARKYKAQMKKPDNSRLLDLLAALSHHTNFSVGCYCKDEKWCHRSLLKELLKERGALIV